MKINVDKCAVLRCTHSLTPLQHAYTLSGHSFDIKKLHTYLGVGIDSNKSWSSHVQMISNKSIEVLNCIKQNLYNCPPDTKRTAYLTLVRPIMEYVAPVWDPYCKKIKILTCTSWRKYKEELHDGFYLNTPELSVLHHYYPLLTYLRYNSFVNHQG